MKQLTVLKSAIICAVIFFATACDQAAENKTAEVKTEGTETEAAPPDNAKLKAEIQALENAWANADNARDLNTLAAFYSDDAISMSNNAPSQVGKAAIKKDMEMGLLKRPKGSTTAYDVIDAFGGGNYVTETGTITRKDSTGKVLSTGKYMAIWEKRDGKWICIRDISNDDAKAK